MKKIYLLRHGQTDWNVEGRLQGRKNIPMNSAGVKQMLEIAERLQKMNFCVDQIISSPLDRAKESVFKNDIKTYEQMVIIKSADKMIEKEIGNGTVAELNATTFEEMKAIIREFKKEYEGIVVIINGQLALGSEMTKSETEMTEDEKKYKKWLDEIGIGEVAPENAIAKFAKVGDYVKYEPDGAIPESLPLELSRRQINWRVLKNDGTKVTLISETPIDSITLSGADGFLNGPSNLDTTYIGLYSGSKGTARNLKVEDVNEVVGYKATEALYYGADNIWHPVPYGTTIGEIENNLSSKVTARNTPDGKALENYKVTFYEYNLNNYLEGKELLSSMLCNGAYWLSSTTVTVWLNKDDCADFGVCVLSSGNVDRNILYESWGGAGTAKTHQGRAIVELNTSVEVNLDENGNGESTTPWILK